MRILVTGGAGFIGSALVRRLIDETDHSVLNIDKLTYAASRTALAPVEASPRYGFRQADICDGSAMAKAFREFRPDAVMHLAAESHVDRSIEGPEVFVETNTVGTLRLLEAARAYLETARRRRRAKNSASITSRPTRSSARSGRTMRPSPRRRPTSRAHLIPRARRPPIISCAPGVTPMGCRCSFRTAPTITARIIFPRN